MKTVWKIVYLISAAAVGAGSFFAFLFIIFNLGDGLLGNDNKPAAFEVAAFGMWGL